MEFCPLGALKYDIVNKMKQKRIIGIIGIIATFLLLVGGVLGSGLLPGEKLTALLYQLSLDSLPESEFVPPEKGKVVRVDLEDYMIYLYRDGEMVGELEMVSKGRPGTPWETPTGTYRILTREKNHFSSIGEVNMPYSMQFFGNFFIHGWPYYPDGTPVAQGYSGGCIRLTDKNARKVYEFVDYGTEVYVEDKTAGSADQADLNGEFYFLKDLSLPPKLTAEAYLVADIATGDVLYAKNKDRVLPAHELTKLATALTSLEVINQYKNATVASASGGKVLDGGFTKGDRILTGDLIYPLLLESSNTAARSLAEFWGSKRFVRSMNTKARSVGLDDTLYVDTTGDSPANTTTAGDIFRLARHIYNNKRFIYGVTVLAEKSATNPAGTKTYTWENANAIAGVKGRSYLGGLNIMDGSAGAALSVFSLPLAEFSSRDIAVILMNSTDIKGDTTLAVDFLEGNFYYGVGKGSATAKGEENLFSLIFSKLEEVGSAVLEGQLDIETQQKLPSVLVQESEH